MTPSLYDLLDLEPTAGDAEIRAAWKAAIADLDPSDRRFRAYNQAAEVLLDPERRAAYDAELAAREAEEADGPVDEPPAPLVAAAPATTKASRPSKKSKTAEPTRGPDTDPDTGAAWPAPSGEPVGAGASGGPVRRVIPAWLLVALGVLSLALIATTAWVSTRPSDESVEDATRAAQAAAERAVVPILSYDYRRLDQDRDAATALMTDDYRDDYDQLFSVIEQNAPRAEAVVGVEVIASAIVRSGTDRAEFLLFLNRPTTNVENEQPVIFKDQVRVQVEKVGEDWLVDCLITTPEGRCD